MCRAKRKTYCIHGLCNLLKWSILLFISYLSAASNWSSQVWHYFRLFHTLGAICWSPLGKQMVQKRQIDVWSKWPSEPNNKCQACTTRTFAPDSRNFVAPFSLEYRQNFSIDFQFCQMLVEKFYCVGFPEDFQLDSRLGQCQFVISTQSGNNTWRWSHDPARLNGITLKTFYSQQVNHVTRLMVGEH